MCTTPVLLSPFFAMCPPCTTAQQPEWQLEGRGDAWRLSVRVPSSPEIELSETSVRLVLKDADDAIVWDVPEKALPVDTNAARCVFSRKRQQLIIEWPRCAGGESCPDSPATSLPIGKAAQQQLQAEPKTQEAACNVSDTAAPQELVTAEEWRARGNAAVKLGDHGSAVAHYTAGIEVGDGDQVLLRSNRALCYHKLGRFGEAVDDARWCVAAKPEFYKGYLRGALALRALGQPEHALAFLKNAPANDEIGKLVSELRPEAEAAEKKRIEALGGAERAKAEGNVLFKKGLFEAAIKEYERALHLCDDPKGEIAIALRNNRAACYHQLSDYTNVVKDTSFVLEHEPGNAKALLRRMLALEPLERYEEALKDARAALQQEPHHEMANKVQHRLGKLVRDRSRAEAAGA